MKVQVIERTPTKFVVQLDDEHAITEWCFDSRREAGFCAAEVVLELEGQRLPFWTQRTEGV